MKDDTEGDTAVTTTPVDTKLDPALEVGSAPTQRQAVAVREPSQAPAAAPRPGGMLKLIAPIGEIIQAQNDVRDFIQKALVEGRDYGVIPGVAKPSLLKPGAERVNNGYGVIPDYEIVEQEVDHNRENVYTKENRIYEDGTWTGQSTIDELKSFGLYRFVVRCKLIQRDTGVLVGSGLGSCSTLESKYISRPRDSENTVWKMACKRAFVGATLTAYGLSEQFTQDVEDMGLGETVNAPPKTPAPICPVHNVPMKDQRQTKKNVKAPDWKCTRFDMAGNVKTWCDEKKWPGEWPPKNPSAPTSTNSGTGSAPASANTTPVASAAANPTSAKSNDESKNSSTNTSGDNSPDLNGTTGTTPVPEITRDTVIDWATSKQLKVIQGKTLADLVFEQLDYFRRHPELLPGDRPGWSKAIVAEMDRREMADADPGNPYP